MHSGATARNTRENPELRSKCNTQNLWLYIPSERQSNNGQVFQKDTRLTTLTLCWVQCTWLLCHLLYRSDHRVFFHQSLAYSYQIFLGSSFFSSFWIHRDLICIKKNTTLRPYTLRILQKTKVYKHGSINCGLTHYRVLSLFRSRAQQESPILDIVTGFQVMDGEKHIFVLEGLREKAVKLMWETLPRPKAKGNLIRTGPCNTPCHKTVIVMTVASYCSKHV